LFVIGSSSPNSSWILVATKYQVVDIPKIKIRDISKDEYQRDLIFPLKFLKSYPSIKKNKVLIIKIKIMIFFLVDVLLNSISISSFNITTQRVQSVSGICL
jgi:hypothetical protein